MQNKKSGFSFGVILGAVIGTGAIVLSKSKEGKSISSKVVEKIKNLKEDYPEQAEKLENVVSDALSEAKTLTKEIKELDIISSTQSKPKAKTKKETRTFVRNKS